MKFFNRSKPSPVSTPTQKTRQELIVRLESRRLMSLTGGVDYLPASDASMIAPTQITHSFGFERSLSNAGDAHFATPSEFSGGQPDFSTLEAQFARAIALGAPVIFGDPNVADGHDLMADAGATIQAAHVNTLTSMYSSISSSTVQSIDAASTNPTVSAEAALSTANGTNSPEAVSDSAANIVSTSTAAATSVVNQRLTVASAATEIANNPGTLNATITPAVMLPASALTLQTSGPSVAADAALPSHITLQNVEQELLTVSTLASEMISQLGRDIAIELSHLESNLSFDGLNEQFTTHWDGWRSAAAVTGAAIATIVYVQSEADREKPKTIFSGKLIEAIPN